MHRVFRAQYKLPLLSHQTADDEGFSEMDGIALSLLSASSALQSESNGMVRCGPLAMERAGNAGVRCATGESVIQGNHDNGRLPAGVGHDTTGTYSQWHVVTSDGSPQHKCAGDVSSVFSTKTLSASSAWVSCVGEDATVVVYQLSGWHSLSAAAQVGSEANCGHDSCPSEQPM